MVAVDGQDTNIEQVNEQFKGSNFSSLRCPPKQTLVEVLPDSRLLHC